MWAHMRRMRAGLALAVALISLGLAPPLVAGIPNRCDLARIAARTAIHSKYEQLLSELDRRISTAKADGKDPGHSVVSDASGQTRLIDVASLAAELGDQQRMDISRADRQVLQVCANDSDAVENARQAAETTATAGISAVVWK